MAERIIVPARRARRSPCPVAGALDLLGDRWTLLIVRDLVLGRTRFKDFLASPEGIPTNILTDRLRRLVTARLVRRVPASPGGRHLAYRLTPSGESLRPLLRHLRNWGLNHVPGTSIHLKTIGVPGGRPARKSAAGRLRKVIG